MNTKRIANASLISEGKRAVIYARVSTDEQRDDHYSIPAQLGECFAFARANGYTVVGDRFVDPKTGRDCSPAVYAIPAYVDDFTGTRESRPALDDLRRFLLSSGFDVLVVHHLDRLARDEFIRRKIELDFEEADVAIEYVLGDYESSEVGEFRKGIDSVFARHENTTRVRRSRMGKRKKAERGLFVYKQPPFGYDIDDEAKARLAVNEDQAAIVRYIFEWYAKERLSIQDMTRRLLLMGIPSPSGKATWAKSTLSRMLGNRTYVGEWVYQKTRMKAQGLHTVRTKCPPEDWIKVETTPLISKSVFDLAQKRLEENRSNRRAPGEQFYLLRGIIFCEDCGRPYVPQTQRRRGKTYRSYRHRIRDGHCRNHQLPAQKIEKAAWNTIKRIMLRPEIARQAYEKSAAEAEQRSARLQARLAGLEREKARLDKKADKLIHTYLEEGKSGITRAQFLRVSEDIKSQLTDVEAQIRDAHQEIDSSKLEDSGIMSFDEFMELTRMFLVEEPDSMTPESMRKALRAREWRVEVGRGSARLKVLLGSRRVGSFPPS